MLKYNGQLVKNLTINGNNVFGKALLNGVVFFEKVIFNKYNNSYGYSKYPRETSHTNSTGYTGAGRYSTTLPPIVNVNGSWQFDWSNASWGTINTSNVRVGYFCGGNDDSIKTGDLYSYTTYAMLVTSIYSLFGGTYAGCVRYDIGSAAHTYMGVFDAEETHEASEYPEYGRIDTRFYVCPSKFFTSNTVLNGSGQGTSYGNGWCVTDYIPLPAGCSNITIYCGGTGSHSCVHEFGENKNYLSWWGASTTPRTFTLDYPYTARYIRATFNMDNVEDCYIIDNQNGSYIFRGKNV